MTSPLKKLTHSCRVAACPRQVPVHLLMCISHWRMVPAAVQREVWTAYRGRDAGPAAFQAYEAAVARAVAAVVDKLMARHARPGSQGDLLG